VVNQWLIQIFDIRDDLTIKVCDRKHLFCCASCSALLSKHTATSTGLASTTFVRRGYGWAGHYKIISTTCFHIIIKQPCFSTPNRSSLICSPYWHLADILLNHVKTYWKWWSCSHIRNYEHKLSVPHQTLPSSGTVQKTSGEEAKCCPVICSITPIIRQASRPHIFIKMFTAWRPERKCILANFQCTWHCLPVSAAML
jgi:hypothetical protein